jgi:hypothetical protein
LVSREADVLSNFEVEAERVFVVVGPESFVRRDNVV